MLNGGAAGHNFFGDSPKFHGQKKEWRFQKVKWLADQGFELCDHTLWHAKLNKYRDAVVQEQIARNVMGDRLRGAGLQDPHDGAAVWHVAEEPRSSRGRERWTDPEDEARRTRTSSTRCSRWRAARRGARTIRSSIRTSINRIEAIGNDIAQALDGLDKTKTRFVK